MDMVCSWPVSRSNCHGACRRLGPPLRSTGPLTRLDQPTSTALQSAMRLWPMKLGLCVQLGSAAHRACRTQPKEQAFTARPAVEVQQDPNMPWFENSSAVHHSKLGEATGIHWWNHQGRSYARHAVVASLVLAGIGDLWCCVQTPGAASSCAGRRAAAGSARRQQLDG